jgi:hypothetical protein
MGATIKMFSQDTVMQRIRKSTLKLWRKQDSEQKLGRESQGRKPCPVECSVNSVAFLAVFCVVQASNRAVNGVFSPPFPLFFVKKKRGALICFAIINGGR